MLFYSYSVLKRNVSGLWNVYVCFHQMIFRQLSRSHFHHPLYICLAILSPKRDWCRHETHFMFIAHFWANEKPIDSVVFALHLPGPVANKLNGIRFTVEKPTTLRQTDRPIDELFSMSCQQAKLLRVFWHNGIDFDSNSQHCFVYLRTRVHSDASIKAIFIDFEWLFASRNGVFTLAPVECNAKASSSLIN